MSFVNSSVNHPSMVSNSRDALGEKLDAIKEPSEHQLIMLLAYVAFSPNVDVDVISRVVKSAFVCDLHDDVVELLFLILAEYPSSCSLLGSKCVLRPYLYSQLKQLLSAGSTVATSACVALLKAGCFSDGQVEDVARCFTAELVPDDVRKLVRLSKLRRLIFQSLGKAFEAFGAHFGEYNRLNGVSRIVFTLKEYHDALMEEVLFSNPDLVSLPARGGALAAAHDCKSVSLPSPALDGSVLHKLCRTDREGFRKFGYCPVYSFMTPSALCAAANDHPIVVDDETKLLTATVAHFSEKTDQNTLSRIVQAISRHAWRLGAGLHLPSSKIGRALAVSLRCSDARGCAEDVASFCLPTVEKGPGFVSLRRELRLSVFGRAEASSTLDRQPAECVRPRRNEGVRDGLEALDAILDLFLPH